MLITLFQTRFGIFFQTQKMSWLAFSFLKSPLNCLQFGTCIRKLAIPATGKTHYRVLMIGGGTAGCAVAARLRDVIPTGAVGVIEPKEVSSASTLIMVFSQNKIDVLNIKAI